ncbi:RAMP superfamily CRISPR-associated protein [Selenomonas sp. KH1T6]|uniref:RAMP superfamily CRISPR-associated protein n=1 Tax=Selenomonas sp. KH1T6 TaxID=3158784 RepID=UPI0008A7D2A3|nr:CRISPR/Cas system CSM-associated protein Csm3, group 7 of RAMP superfamily [Selenomonas ruminantium]
MSKGSIRGKLCIAGNLLLKAPLLIGMGGHEEGSQTDIQILKDKKGYAFIPGTSLAGVLRQYVEGENPRAAALLFGTDLEQPFADEMKLQSSTIIYDIKLSNVTIVHRDSVNLDGLTGTGIKHGKFDYEVIDKGAHGTFVAEIILRNIHESDKDLLEKTLVRLGSHLADGFHLGARTAIGFGKAVLEDISIAVYDFQNADDTAAYFLDQPPRRHSLFEKKESEHAYPEDSFVVDADFLLEGGLMVRDSDKSHLTGSGAEEGKLDAIMMRDSDGKWLVPGSSLKGVLRHRCEYILQSLGKNTDMLESLMGPDPQKLREHLSPKSRSRFLVDEIRLSEAVQSYPQTRIRVDRFTGGTIDSALFTSMPVWQKETDKRALTMHWEISHAQPWEIGLALLLLKDAWLGRIAIGSGKSIGYGRLRGLKAELYYKGKPFSRLEGPGIQTEEAGKLQKFVDEFINMKEAGA